MRQVLWYALPIVALLSAWEFVSGVGTINASLFPPPSKVAVALYDLTVTGTIFTDLYASAWRLLAGLFIGSATGVLLGLLTGRVKSIERALNPIIQVLRPLPPVAIIPLVIVWFGIDDGAKIFSIAFAVFFPVWINAHIGAGRIPQTFLWSAQLLSKSQFHTFTRIIFPATLPFIVSGIRTAIAIAAIMVFVSELSGASSGLGYRISITSLSYRIDEMIAALFILGALGATLDQVFILATKKLFPWIALKQ